jgi:hypothetical protein
MNVLTQILRSIRGLQGMMNTIELHSWQLEEKSIQEERDMKISGRTNSLFEELDLFVWSLSQPWIINYESSNWGAEGITQC